MNQLEKKVCEIKSPRKIEELVEFSVGEKKFYLPQGFYLVRDLKHLAGVPECHLFAEIRDGKVDEKPSDDATHICGGEKFCSYPGKGDAS